MTKLRVETYNEDGTVTVTEVEGEEVVNDPTPPIHRPFPTDDESAK